MPHGKTSLKAHMKGPLAALVDEAAEASASPPAAPFWRTKRMSEMTTRREGSVRDTSAPDAEALKEAALDVDGLSLHIPPRKKG